jgi:spore coat protein SA
VGSDYLRTLKERKPENVEFGEYVTGETLGDEFRQASIFCCPSVWNEPFGMVNVEAMACGLPIVASAVGGIPEIFRHGGAMLVPGGSVSALADALEILITDPARRKEIAAEGTRSFEEHFRWAVIRDEYMQLVETLQERA